MSRTSLGQRNQQVRRDMGSKIKQITSVVRPEQGQQHWYSLQQEEANLFKFMRDKYDRVERQTQYMNCELGETLSYVKDDFGKYIFDNGDQYIGEWRNQQMQGLGKYTYFQPRKVYLGQFASGVFHGFGTLIEPQDNLWSIIYQGDWENGYKHGRGQHFYQYGKAKYSGEWKHNMRDGLGTFRLPNAQYSGHWIKDKREGEGKLTIYDRGLTMVYEGGEKDQKNQKIGWTEDKLPYGTISYFQSESLNPSKSTFLGKYKGDLQDGKKHGWGCYQWPANNKSSAHIQFDGMFKNDKINGRGKIIVGKTVFQGQFEAFDNSLGGPQFKGIINYENGDIFDGIISIRNGDIRKEKGIYYFSNGDKADGNFVDNEHRECKGRFLYEWSNGRTKQY